MGRGRTRRMERKGQTGKRTRDLSSPRLSRTSRGWKGCSSSTATRRRTRSTWPSAPEQFDRIHLCSITRTQGDGHFFDSASLVHVGRGFGTFPFVFQRVGKQVFFAHKNVYYRAEPDAAIHRAVDRGLSDSILGAGAIEGQPHPETGAVLVDPSAFLHPGYRLRELHLQRAHQEDRLQLPGRQELFRRAEELSAEHRDRRGACTSAPKAPKMDIPTLADVRSFRHVYHYSLSSLPESDFRPRAADDRVGHFNTLYQDYTSVLGDDPYVRYVNRWHLEKAEPRFERSPPKKPIVFWLENTIPGGVPRRGARGHPGLEQGLRAPRLRSCDRRGAAARRRRLGRGRRALQHGALDGSAGPGLRRGPVAHQSLHR